MDAGKNSLELAEYHAKRHNARRDQVEGCLCRIPKRTIEVPEDRRPRLDHGADHCQRKAHRWGEPEQRCSRIVHAELLVLEQQVRQTPAQTAECARADDQDESTEHKVTLSRDHQKYPGEYQKYYSDEAERKGLQAE